VTEAQIAIALFQSFGIQLRLRGGAIDCAYINSQPVSPTAHYRMAIDSFYARGGGVLPNLLSHSGFNNTRWVDADVLKEFIANLRVIEPAQFQPKALYIESDDAVGVVQ
jgi:5'-nucleotidase/UDP-sugar diphosphatase